MTIYDFINLCVDSSFLKLEIYDTEEGTVIYSGYADELPFELEDEEISSFDVPTKLDWITLNIR